MTRQRVKRLCRKTREARTGETNKSPEIPDKGVASDIPSVLSGQTPPHPHTYTHPPYTHTKKKN